MVLRPGSKIRTTTVSSQRGEVHAPLSLVARPSPYHRSPRHHSRPSRSCRGCRAASCGCRGGTAGGAGPPDRQHARQGQRPQQRTSSGRLPVQAGDHLPEPPRAAVPGDASFPGRLGALTSLRRVRRWRWVCCTDPIVCPDVLGGGDIGQRDRVERPEAGLGQVRCGRANRWALAPASFAAPGRCSRAFPIQPRRD
jgi:hypothetical protein